MDKRVKVKASPSLKGILKEELREEVQYLAADCRTYADKIGANLEETMTDRFHSVYVRLSDLEKAAIDKVNAGFDFETIYYILLCVLVAFSFVYFIMNKSNVE